MSSSQILRSSVQSWGRMIALEWDLNRWSAAVRRLMRRYGRAWQSPARQDLECDEHVVSHRDRAAPLTGGGQLSSGTASPSVTR